jgi:regulatory protein
VPGSIITKIERQKRARHRVSVFVDDEFAFGISEETALKFGLARGRELTPVLRADIDRADVSRQAKSAAERFVARRMHSEKELRSKLTLKGFSENVIDETITVFRNLRLIDDRAFAEMFIRDRMRLRPKGRPILRRELLQKGIAEDIIDAVLPQLIDEDRELEEIRLLAEKYLRRNIGMPEELRRRRLLGFLQRRGFPFSAIMKILREGDSISISVNDLQE